MTALRSSARYQAPQVYEVGGASDASFVSPARWLWVQSFCLIAVSSWKIVGISPQVTGPLSAVTLNDLLADSGDTIDAEEAVAKGLGA